MNAPRIIPAAPMGLDDILPLIREVSCLRERGHYDAAAELEETIRRPLTVAGYTLTPYATRWSWYGCTPDTRVVLTVNNGQWQATIMADTTCAATVSTGGFGSTIAAALSDARMRYQASIASTLLRMGTLLREVAL